MATSPSNGTYATGGVLPGFSPTGNQITHWNVGLGSQSITWTTSFTNITPATFSMMTGLPVGAMKRKRGWNGGIQPRCADCMRWGKQVDARTVKCKHCKAEMPAW